MSKERRTFSPEDRYSLVQEALRDGHSEVCRKYNGTGRPALAFSSKTMEAQVP